MINKSNTRRVKGSDKKKKTFNKYGKNTSRGLRIKTHKIINMIDNSKYSKYYSK